VTDELLALELRVLILGHGRRRVLQVLARLGDQSAEELERDLTALEHKRMASSKRPKASLADVIDAQCAEHPGIAEPLRTLGTAFQNRTFLPQLRDVQRFMERLGARQTKFKSRDAAGPVLMKVLGGMAHDRLRELALDGSTLGDSDYSMLARAILGKSPHVRDADERSGAAPDRPKK
jgi:hypothetical protein